MTPDPAAAVIVLLYNDLPHGLAAVASALAQTYANTSVHILDNGSTDGTWAALQTLNKDPRVTLIRNPRNQRSEFAARYAHTVEQPYLSFLWTDDRYHPDRIAHAVRYLEANPHAEYVFYRNTFVDETGAELRQVPITLYAGDITSMNRWQHLRHMLFEGNTLHPCGMIIRTTTYKRLGGFSPFLHRIGDMTFFARLLANAEGTFFPDRMQTITAWSNGRNESATNAIPSEAVAFERTQFLEEYLRPELLAHLEEIFAPVHGPAIALEGEAARLWFLAHQMLQATAFDMRLFAFRLLYRAAALADVRLQATVIATTGRSISDYIYRLSSRPYAYTPLPPVTGQGPARSRLREAIKRIPCARRLHRLLRRWRAALPAAR